MSRVSGRLSYPLYIVHYPLIYIFAHWYWRAHPSTPQLWLVAASLYVGVILLAWLLLKYYDEPLRAWLTRNVSATGLKDTRLAKGPRPRRWTPL